MLPHLSYSCSKEHCQGVQIDSQVVIQGHRSRAPIHVYTSVGVCLRKIVYVYACLCVCVCTCAYVCYACACACVYVCVCVCACTWVHACLYASVCVSVCARVCMCEVAKHATLEEMHRYLRLLTSFERASFHKRVFVSTCSHLCVVALRQVHNELVCVCCPCSCLDFLHACIGARIPGARTHTMLRSYLS